MSTEEKIKQALEEKFAFLKDNIQIKRERRIFCQVPPEKFGEVLKFVNDGLCMSYLSAITGRDCTDSFEVIYHFSKEGGIMLNLKVRLDRNNPVINSITGRFPAADAYERELADLLGIQVQGLAPGRRYPLPDEWPQGQHPLRKDWICNLDPETPGALKNCAGLTEPGKEAADA
jgi:membrane-bound hydrogenase subunit beta